MSKKMSSILIVGLLATILAACGPADLDETPTSAPVETEEMAVTPTDGMDTTGEPTAEATGDMTTEPTDSAMTDTPTGTASITVTDQAVVDGTVVVDEVVSVGPGWVVVHADDAGEPGEIVGFAAVADGTNTHVVVELDNSVDLTETLHVELHQDTGAVGTFEYPDDPTLDPAVMVDGEPVSTSFMLSDV